MDKHVDGFECITSHLELTYSSNDAVVIKTSPPFALYANELPSFLYTGRRGRVEVEAVSVEC